MCCKINPFVYIFFSKKDFPFFWKNRFFIHKSAVFSPYPFPDVHSVFFASDQLTFCDPSGYYNGIT